MMWQVRALLDDRPGALAALAEGCGDRNVNILGLQIFPSADGRVVDELILHTPGGWGTEDVERLCAHAGVDTSSVVPCSPRALEDQPVRYLRAAQAVAQTPELLEEQLGRLLDAAPSGGPAGDATLVLDDEHGPSVCLSREVPFTDTERARAAELRRVAAGNPVTDSLAGQAVGAPAVPDASAGDRPDARDLGQDVVELRPGALSDVRSLTAMHARCSTDTLYRRFHAPLPRLSPRLARALLVPVEGLSLVASVGGEIVASGMLALVADDDPREVTAELGILVEDGFQRQGIGTRLLHELAVEAASQGVDTLLCTVQPDNDAVLATIRRAQLKARVSVVDGVTQYRIPVHRLAGMPRRSDRRVHNRPTMGEITTPLVALLHGRRELREVHPAADLIDQAIRGGA
jgi:GNAT superfamily N-acetyltransferase